MPLELPDVTVVVIDAVAHDLTCLALEDTLREITPALICIWSNDVRVVPATSVPIHYVRAAPRSLEEVGRLLWYDVPRLVETSHALFVQWDGWPINGSIWDSRWLNFDFIGAPWGWHGDGLEVGNGGFSLRSRRLMRRVAELPRTYWLGAPEDAVLCRVHRPRLEQLGFRWASVEEAERFAFERAAPRPSFGFHGAWNFPSVLNRDRLLRRLDLANNYVRGKTEWRQLWSAARPVLGSVPLSSPATAIPSS